MKRLTKRDKNGTAIAPEFADKTYIMQDDHDKFTGYINSPIVDRLAKLEDKLESGQLIDLCAGEKIWWLLKVRSGWKEDGSDAEYEIKPVWIYSIHSIPEDTWVDYYPNPEFKGPHSESLYGCFRYKKQFNKEFFKTQAQAEARLKELQKERNG